MATTLEFYVSSFENALLQNPPRNSPAYGEDPEGVWRYWMRVFGSGLADFPKSETAKIYSTLYGRLFVRIETFGANRAKVDAKEFVEWIRSAEAEEREKRKRMDAAKMQLAYFIMTHFPEDYERSLDEGWDVCETTLQIITRLTGACSGRGEPPRQMGIFDAAGDEPAKASDGTPRR